MQERIRILIVDDHAVVRAGLVALIGTEPDLAVVGSVGSAAEAIDHCVGGLPDLILMDVRMPDVDGIAALQRLRERFPTVRVLMLSSHDGDDAIHRAFKAGAIGYLLKHSEPAQFIASIRQAARGRLQVSSEVAEKLADRVGQAELSPRELEVLQRMALGDTNKQIASVLGISVSTTSHHVNAILFKLDAADRTQAVTLALRRGIISLE